MWICVQCKRKNADNNDHCSFCNCHKPIRPDNYCDNPSCSAYKVLVPFEQNYCNECHSATVVFKEIEKMC